jgi:hypothetical protein
LADHIKELVEQLKTSHGENLVSIVLYGSGAQPSANQRLDDSHNAETGNKNILVVLDQITPAELRHAHGAAERWRAAGNPLPVYFTSAEIENSADVFPVEFIDLSHAHQVLAGRDPFENLKIPKRNLRHQLEYELRGKLLRLRALYIPASENTLRLARLMHDSLMTYAVLFRHVISMMGSNPPADKRECAIHLAQLLGLDTGVFNKIFNLASEDYLPLQAEVNDTFAAYLVQIEKVIDAVDRLPVEAD